MMLDGTAPQARPRVVAVGPMPPEKSAYALARYSRSPDSIVDSLAWVRDHDEKKFLESFYFDYGHASIADLGHLAICFEGISELAAIEIEDEPLWDGQAKSSRYQDFSRGSIVVPPGLSPSAETTYLTAAERLLADYKRLHPRLAEYMRERNPKPPEMKEGRYKRTMDARAYDVVRYLLFLGISTNIGQVTSIRTLEKQMRRMGASRYGELRDVASELREICAAPPTCTWDGQPGAAPLAPTLARHAAPDIYSRDARARLANWAAGNLKLAPEHAPKFVDLVEPSDPLDDIAATLLYGVTQASFRTLHDTVSTWSSARKCEVLEVVLQSRGKYDELLREFSGGYRFSFDIACDIGAYRDMHRHRRCIQVRQEYNPALGAELPPEIEPAGVAAEFHAALRAASAAQTVLAVEQPESAHYLMPFAGRVRALFKMDFAEVEYICRVRSGVKGHISYRKVAWEMRERMVETHSELARLINATPPWEVDALTR